MFLASSASLDEPFLMGEAAGGMEESSVMDGEGLTQPKREAKGDGCLRGRDGGLGYCDELSLRSTCGGKSGSGEKWLSLGAMDWSTWSRRRWGKVGFGAYMRGGEGDGGRSLTA